MKKYQFVLSSWIDSNLQKELQEAIRTHLPDNKWRLVK